jgi:hypothetical protein
MGKGKRSDTTPDDDDLVLEKETIIDLDVPETKAEDVRGGARVAGGGVAGGGVRVASNAGNCCDNHS